MTPSDIVERVGTLDEVRALFERDGSETFRYDPETGHIFWKRARQSHWNGKRACRALPNGYLRVTYHRRTFLAHRVIWFLVHGKWPAEELDHINGDPSDNRIENLREASTAQNKQNRRMSGSNKSGFKGVSWHKATKRWRAVIEAHGKAIHLGTFKTPEAAHAKYAEAAQKYHGEFARTI